MKKFIYSSTFLLLVISAILFYSFCMRDGHIDSIHIARITKNIDHISGLTLMDLYLEKKVSPEEYQALWEVMNEKRLKEAKEILALFNSTEGMYDAPLVKIYTEQLERLENSQSLVFAHDEIINKTTKGLSAQAKQYIREKSIGGYKSFDWSDYYIHKRKYESKP